jgi:MSHA biogenesis protein MshL
MKLPAVVCIAGLLGACSSTTPYPPKNLSVQQSIDDTLKQASAPKPAQAPVTLPPSLSHSLLPPLRETVGHTAPAQPEPRFDLVVTDASINQVLHAIASDTRYSILLSPRAAAPRGNVTGSQQPEPQAQAAANASRELMTVRLKNVTVFEALDAIRDTYGYEYTVSGTRIYVEPPELQTRLYQINYTLGQRRGVSDLQVITGAAQGGSGSGSGSGSSGSSTVSSTGGGGSSYASNQASALSTVSKSDLWGEMEDSLRTILGCQIPRLQASAARSGGQGGGGQGGSSSSGSASSRADVSYVGEAQPGERMRGVDGCVEGRAVNVNQMTGTVLVRGMPRELRTVERLLRAMQVNVERQVIIEAKVIDVQLNRESQQGINWAAFNQNLMRAGIGVDPRVVGAPGTPNSGKIVNGASTADLLAPSLIDGTARTAFNAGLGVVLQGAQFAALVSFLETQGDVRVLSSPRISTLNNQKAVIKVGTEEPFVTNIVPGSTSLSAAASITLPPTLTYQPFFSGISLDVTPQIDERDRVTLHVHAMVNSIVEKQKISSPAPGAVPVPLAVNSVNETDSMVKTPDGMMVVIGGLMTENTDDTRAAIPGLGEVPLAGALFRKGGQQSSKRELVILIKPTVMKADADWSDDIASTGRRIQNMNAGADPRTN